MKHTLLLSLSGAMVFLFVLNSCTKTVAVKQPEKMRCDTVSYKKHIKPLFISNCAKSGCHDEATNAGGVVIPAQIKEIADTKRIHARVINGEPTYMPADKGRLPGEQIEMIKCWLDAGAPINN
jgi:hypothetical protein